MAKIFIIIITVVTLSLAVITTDGHARSIQVGVISPQADLTQIRHLLGQAIAIVNSPTLSRAQHERDAVLADWDEHYWHLGNQLSGDQPFPAAAVKQVYDAHALVNPQDGDQLGVVIHRTEVLLEKLKTLKGSSQIDSFYSDLAKLKATAEKTPIDDTVSRKGLYFLASYLNRRISFSNPLIDFDEILFVARGVYNGSRKQGWQGTEDKQGQHFHTQYYAFNSIPGGGLFKVSNFKTSPRIVNLTEGSTVASGRLKGKQLQPGAFISPDLSYDGKTILFSYTENHEHKW